MIQEALPDLPSNNGEVKKPNRNYSPEIESAEDSKRSTLIEFPGGRDVPEWRKQLSKRVREVQERKAREAAEELAAAQEAGLVSCAMPSGQLELVPDLENPIVNPIVSKALERLERARRSDYSASHHAATAFAPALDPETQALATSEVSDTPVVGSKRKLTVVAAPQPIVEPVEMVTEELIADDSFAPQIESIAVESPIAEPTLIETAVVAATAVESMVRESFTIESTGTEDLVEPEVEQPPAHTRLGRKPIRVISDNDVALSYLENCLSVPALSTDTRSDLAGLTRRFFSGLVDLLIIAIMVSPAVAAMYYSGTNWSEPKTIGLVSGITAAIMFAYLTVCTAMTGRTLAMRMFRMRTIDLRTGLIPTGGQSITRAITYVFSLALLGLGIAYAVIDPDKRAVHDKLSKTIVIRS
jgi:uncharacterized RDD family membrane protein YckC